MWVLTGDKQETAISIGRSCNVITDDMKVVKINTKTTRGAKRILEKQLEIMEYNQQVRASSCISLLTSYSNRSRLLLTELR